MPLQDLIFKYEMGTGNKVLKLLLAFIAIIALAVVYDVNTFRNLSSTEGMEAAQLARNIADGKGFTTDSIRPFSLYLMKQREIAKNAKPGATVQETNAVAWTWPARVPDVSNAPLYPLLLAGALKLMPFEYPDLLAAKTFSYYLPDLWIVILNQLLLVIAAVLVFRLGRQLFDETVGWVAVAVFAGTELLWRFTYSGNSTMLLIVLFLGAATLLTKLDKAVRDQENPVSSGKLFLWAAGVGLLMGLGGMTRYAFLGMMVAVVIWMLFLPTPKRAGLIFTAVVVFAVVATPWLVRNYDLTGTPFGTASYAAAQNTSLFPEDQLERSLNPDFRLLGTSDYLQKFWTNAREMVQTDLPKLGGSWVTALFLVGLLVPFRNPTIGRMRIFVLMSLGTLFLTQAFGRAWVGTESPEVNTDNLLVVAVPLVFIFGVGLLYVLLESTAKAMRPVILGIFFLLAAAPLLLTFLTFHEMTQFPPWIQDKASRVGEQDVIMTDIPSAVAWYGHRQSVWLTLKHRANPEDKLREDFYAIHEKHPISALYLTAKSLKSIEMQAVSHWVETETEDRDWTSFSKLATGLAEQLKASPNQEYFNKLRALVNLVEQHWIRGDDESWPSFMLGMFINREVPTGFPLKEAPLGLVPEVFLKNSERNSEKAIQSTK